MAYHIYTTTAIVCGSYNRNAADKSFLLFTEQLGMVYATARSVREERSRQRQALQDFSIIRVSLIRGKSGWRIGSVEAYGNPFLRAIDRTTRAQLLRIFKVLRRFIQGEGSEATIFPVALHAIEALASGRVSYPTDYTTQVVARMLHDLGYMSAPALLQDIGGQLPAMNAQLSSVDAAMLDQLIAEAGIASQL